MSEQKFDEKGNSTRDMVFNGPTHTFHGRTTMTLQEVIAKNIEEFEIEGQKILKAYPDAEDYSRNFGTDYIKWKKAMAKFHLFSQLRVIEAVKAWSDKNTGWDGRGYKVIYKSDLFSFLDKGLYVKREEAPVAASQEKPEIKKMLEYPTDNAFEAAAVDKINELVRAVNELKKKI